MNLDYYIKKKHIFKRRVKTKYNIATTSIKNFYQVYTPTNIRIEFVYIKVFKKLLRRKFIKAKTKFFKPKYWIYLMPNYILTQKSKNSRMGAGVGKFLRLVNLKYSSKTIIKTWLYTYTFLINFLKYLNFKLSIKCYLK